MILEEMHTAGVYEYIINNALNQIVFKGKYDGCYERPEYYYLNFYRKGTTHNCFRAGHTNFYKRIYEPKDPELSNAYSQTKKWFSENFIEVPKIGLWSNHSYFSRLNYGKWFVLSYFADPSILDAPKNNFFTEESSEYHKNRIQNYPKHKRIMKKWMITSAERHRNFEQSVNALERHYLNLNEFALLDMQSDNNKEKSNDIVLEIQKLNEMYKSGIITQKEFEKAKKKILE